MASEGIPTLNNFLMYYKETDDAKELDRFLVGMSEHRGRFHRVMDNHCDRSLLSLKEQTDQFLLALTDLDIHHDRSAHALINRDTNLHDRPVQHSPPTRS
jgi:hypothetical protein